MNTLQDGWEIMLKTLPAGTGIVETKKLERFYYAGAACVLGIQRNLEEKNVSDEAGGAVIESLEQEYVDFCEAERFSAIRNGGGV